MGGVWWAKQAGFKNFLYRKVTLLLLGSTSNEYNSTIPSVEVKIWGGPHVSKELSTSNWILGIQGILQTCVPSFIELPPAIQFLVVAGTNPWQVEPLFSTHSPWPVAPIYWVWCAYAKLISTYINHFLRQGWSLRRFGNGRFFLCTGLHIMNFVFCC